MESNTKCGLFWTDVDHSHLCSDTREWMMGESGDDMPKFLNGRQAVVRSLLILLSTLSACQTRYQCRMRTPVFNNCNVLTPTAAKTESAALNLVLSGLQRKARPVVPSLCRCGQGITRRRIPAAATAIRCRRRSA